MEDREEKTESPIDKMMKGSNKCVNRRQKTEDKKKGLQIERKKRDLQINLCVSE